MAGGQRGPLRSLAWGIVFDGFRPDRYDLAGALVCLVGVPVLVYAPRRAAPADRRPNPLSSLCTFAVPVWAAENTSGPQWSGARNYFISRKFSVVRTEKTAASRSSYWMAS